MIDATLKAINIKYVFELILWIATGHICATIMDPIAPPLAEILSPLARM
jgi:hypothetical protein